MVTVPRGRGGPTPQAREGRLRPDPSGKSHVDVESDLSPLSMVPPGPYHRQVFNPASYVKPIYWEEGAEDSI
ncbi:hypothetical protein [Oryza sativa Japonica Group]|uniref:Uncharacterized protein n=1 Tax=Oryza sativa subsp. japonica TaxID=39947 RepID=Q657Z0_ORYSJ|nr:hypothetical protein [Oryza sativa Japonica Group]